MNDKYRVSSLDSIRGIAAFSVLLFHCYLLSHDFKRQIDNVIETYGFPWGSSLSLYMNLFTSGRSAVIIFFVLSGFVLTLSLLNRKQSYKKFILSRIFRIYPVLAISVILSYLLHAFIGNNQVPAITNSDWYQFWVAPPIALTIKDLSGHLALTGISPNQIYLNGPIWSLSHETRFYFIFPLLVLLFYKSKEPAKFIILGIILSIAGGMAASFLILAKYVTVGPSGFAEATLLYSFVQTIYFLIFLIAGVFLAIRREKIYILINKLPNIAKSSLLIISLICLFYYDSQYSDFVDYLRGIGAFILIALAFSWHSLEKFLASPTLLWLGKISYSLYLVHWLVIYSMSELFGNIFPLWIFISIIIIASLICAELMSRFVENPCLNLGKKLLQKMK
jgi:peptidoglycan/LPS O-acetylase OafA/YrhL